MPFVQEHEETNSAFFRQRKGRFCFYSRVETAKIHTYIERYLANLVDQVVHPRLSNVKKPNFLEQEMVEAPLSPLFCAFQALFEVV